MNLYQKQSNYYSNPFGGFIVFWNNYRLPSPQLMTLNSFFVCDILCACKNVLYIDFYTSPVPCRPAFSAKFLLSEAKNQLVPSWFSYSTSYIQGCFTGQTVEPFILSSFIPQLLGHNWQKVEVNACTHPLAFHTQSRPHQTLLPHVFVHPRQRLYIDVLKINAKGIKVSLSRRSIPLPPTVVPSL